jgi:hypothetical protein
MPRKREWINLGGCGLQIGRRAVSDRDCFSQTPRCIASAVLVAPHDIDGFVRPVTLMESESLHRAVRHIGPVGRSDIRRKAMGPIPGNIVCLGVTDIARRCLRSTRRGLAGAWTVRSVVKVPWPESPKTSKISEISRVMPEEGMRYRARRDNPAASRSRPCKGLVVGGKHQRDHAKRGDQRRIHFIRHGTYHSLVAAQPAPQGTLGRAARALQTYN